MFYSKEVRIAQLQHRINILRSRGETMNMRLINALIREIRKLETLA